MQYVPIHISAVISLCPKFRTTIVSKIQNNFFDYQTGAKLNKYTAQNKIFSEPNCKRYYENLLDQLRIAIKTAVEEWINATCRECFISEMMALEYR